MPIKRWAILTAMFCVLEILHTREQLDPACEEIVEKNSVKGEIFRYTFSYIHIPEVDKVTSYQIYIQCGAEICNRSVALPSSFLVYIQY